MFLLRLLGIGRQAIAYIMGSTQGGWKWQWKRKWRKGKEAKELDGLPRGTNTWCLGVVTSLFCYSQAALLWYFIFIPLLLIREDGGGAGWLV